MKVSILTPEKTIFEGEAESVNIKGAAIPFQVLNHHANIVSLIEGKEVNIETQDGTRHNYKVSSGVLQNQNQVLEILVDTAESI